MTTRILFLFREKEKALYRAIRQSLINNLKSLGIFHIEPSWALSEQHAWECIKEQDEGYDLIITHLHIPEEAGKPPIEGENRGLEFLQQLAPRRRVPSILLTPAITDQISEEAGRLYQCTVIPIKMADLTQLVNYQASQKLGLPATTVCSARVKLDININLNESRCEMIPVGAGIHCNDQPLPLQIDPDRIGKLLRTSVRVKEIKDKYPFWKEALEDIGDDLMKEIFRAKEAYAIFQVLRDKAGGLENISIRFCVNRNIHPLILEALNEDLEGHRDFWMLKTPICRKYGVGIGKTRFPPLFEDEETRSQKLNCLIIEAAVSGWVDEIKKDLKPLNSVPEETKKIKTRLKKIEQLQKPGKVDVIREDVSADAVRAKLEDGTVWHIVHFAGHSFYVSDPYDDTKGTGFLALQKDKGTKTRIESLNIRKFSNWLRKAKTRFIYLSSCESSNDDFIYELASNSIPAILGFRWKLDDSKAAEHAEHFYKHLFELKSLEYAFLRTRQNMYDQHKTHNIWAAPMLMMQCRQ